MRYWISFSLLILSVTVAWTGEPDSKVDEAKIKALIDQLVSPNPKPITGNEDPDVAPDYKLPPGYDKEKQKTVLQARVKLKELGPQAFPYLIERWDDKRYCLTMSVGINGYFFNATVGEVCRDIVWDQLQPYGTYPKVEDDPRGKPPRPGYPDEFLATTVDAKKWYEKHKKKSLYEMQLMVVDWVIQEEEKKAGDFTQQERKEMREIRSKLIQSGKPIPRGNYGHNDIEF